MTFTIIIATYGDSRWQELAESRALPSAQEQCCEVLIAHNPVGKRHTVRNGLAERATGDYLVFLDADDRLLPGYVEAMQRAFERESEDGGPPLLLTPAVSYTHPRHTKMAPGKLLKPRAPDLHDGNYLVLGTAVPTDLFLGLGGFQDWNARTGNEWDDWELWIRCIKAGAEVVQVPDAVYVHMQEPESRHRTADRNTALRWQYEIGVVHFPEHYGPNWIRMHGGR